MFEFDNILGWLSIVFPFAMIPIAFLSLLENFFTFMPSKIVMKSLNILQFLFIPILLFLTVQLSIPYKPALLIGLSFVFTSTSVVILLFIIKINTTNFKSISLFKSILASFFVSLLSVGFLAFTFYQTFSNKDFPSVILSFIRMPHFYLLVLGFSTLVYIKDKYKYILSSVSFFFFIIFSINLYDNNKHLISILDIRVFHWINFTFGKLLILLIPLYLVIAVIWICFESKNKLFIWILFGTITLFIALLLAILNFEKYYLLKSVVETIITKSDFILIGIFESLYLLAFAFMGLGLLGFKQMPTQMEATQ